MDPAILCLSWILVILLTGKWGMRNSHWFLSKISRRDVEINDRVGFNPIYNKEWEAPTWHLKERQREWGHDLLPPVYASVPATSTQPTTQSSDSISSLRHSGGNRLRFAEQPQRSRMSFNVQRSVMLKLCRAGGRNEWISQSIKKLNRPSDELSSVAVQRATWPVN